MYTVREFELPVIAYSEPWTIGHSRQQVAKINETFRVEQVQLTYVDDSIKPFLPPKTAH